MTTPHRTLQMALDALDNLGSMSDHDVTPYAWHGAKAEAACAALREALAAPPAAPAPAAPVPDGLATNADEVICPNCACQFRAIPENVQSLLLASGHEPPFTASPAAPAAPVVPLTDEQIRSMWKSSEFRGNGGQVDWFCEGIRAAEAHHGITGGKP